MRVSPALAVAAFLAVVALTPRPAEAQQEVGVADAGDAGATDAMFDAGASASVDAAKDTVTSKDGGADVAADPAAPPVEPGADEIPALVLPPITPAPPSPPRTGDEPLRVSELTVVGTRERQTPGSAHILRSRDLERQDQDDAHQVLKQIPGVYARGEDGFGLRPNIGLRGVDPDRSKKVTLLEDGVLFAPAPYAAPAAYFFPLITRMENVRVIKGPGAVSFGPQTVAGALDLVTRRVPTAGVVAGVDLGAGQYGYGKAHAFAGASNRHLGVLVEGVHLRNDGFKDLDGGGDTGFVRNELMAKLRWVPAPGARVHNELELKLGFSNENSHETYLGLTDADLRRTPQRRYFASRLDRMEWHRTQLQLRHGIDFGGGRSLDTTVYRHELSRTWRKLNHFGAVDGTPVPGISQVLRYPGGANDRFYRTLTGEADTSGSVLLFIGPNDRDFLAQGVQTVASLRVDGAVAHRVEVGVRLHHDRVDRLHTEEPFGVTGRRLERAAGQRITTKQDRDTAMALSLHALDAITWRRLTVTPGLRLELIETKALDRMTGEERDGAPQRVLIPGLGGYFALTEAVGLLGGVHRGFTPAEPGQPASVEPEQSWNFEGGARLGGERGRIEAIGFFNDYRNLTSICTVASGCASERIDTQTSAGRAHVWGAELYARSDLRAGWGLTIPVSFAYTFTRTRLLEAAMTQDPVLGTIDEGDELPYVPRHQGALTVGVESTRIGLHVSGGYTSRMREEAGQGSYASTLTTDPSLVLEAGARLYLISRAHLYLHLRNATNAHDIASRRPYGARPIAPRWVQAGVKATF